MDTHVVLGLGLGFTAILAALGGLLLMVAFQLNRKPVRDSIFDERQKGTLFLFDGETLVDCTPGGQAVLGASNVPGTPWVKLLAYLSAAFPQIDQQLAKLEEEGVVTLASEDSYGQPLLLMAEQRGGLSRITLIDAETKDRSPGNDPLAHRSMTEDLAFLRSMLSQAPFLAWREKDNGDIVWANTAYLLRAGDLFPGKELTWPLPRLFERTATVQGASGQRQKLKFPDGSVSWFDLISMPDGDGRRVYALLADSAVQAEATLRDFMQTLTKTFAHLPIGLAIFDSRRQLQLFNPALLDLTGLPPDFLSLRPSLLSVLDALRDHNMVPEPKDYRGWRRQITDLERAASSGVYEETWNLPGGQTYKVIGRPHPNGALALMIEDISTEITRTRRYRADLELGQSVIDSMDEAMAVFSETGILVMTNAAYVQLWGHDPAESLTSDGITSLSRHWRSQTAPSRLWSEAEEFVGTIGDKEGWSDEVRMLDGRLIICRFTPLSGGATLMGFRVQQATKEPSPLSAAERRSA
ncbi:PAS-domain containing protein [Pseudotabrizicola alkalilacus]|uniref:PAS domain-containing protein n=1 Tax=Pseudotabrizicola alkalilacus TaxID=2305252 RepID=A0A411YY78_9RHOB|nr:PAS-domain containing protein [Pseudotabrizicola alkalilacus]RGP35831.1 PAS domain-containing protein [Pseudotabrizicola alkalilacus]